MANKQTLSKWFSNLSKPTQEQFWEWLNSYWHKEEQIPMNKVEGLNEQLRNTATTSLINNKLEKGSYAGTASDLKSDLEEKIAGLETFFLKFENFPKTAGEGKIILLLANADKMKDAPHIAFPEGTQTAGYYIFNRGIWWRLEDINTASGTFFPPTASGTFR